MDASTRQSSGPDRGSAVAAVALVSRIAAGDEQALGALYDERGAAAYRLALGLTGEAGAAERVVEEAFLDLVRESRAFDPASTSLAAWVARSVWRRSLSVRGIERPALGGAAALGSPASLESLEERERHAVELALYAGLGTRDIAAVLGEGEDHVRRLLASGMQTLRRAHTPTRGIATIPGADARALTRASS